MAREREQALREVEERALYEDEAERRDLDQQRREREGREKEMKKFKAFLNLRKEMMDYNFRKCPRIKKESFTDLQVDDIDVIRIALIGPTGSGKTSFIGKNKSYLFYSSMEFLYTLLSRCGWSISLGVSSDNSAIVILFRTQRLT